MGLTAAILGPILNTIALIAGALWVYWRFRRQREREPGAEIDLEVGFVGTQDNSWLIEVTALLENKSLVQQRYEDFEVVVRYLLPEDEVIDGGERISYQLFFERTIDARIEEGKKRRFANASYINPRLKFKHRYITAVPEHATFVWVQCSFFFEVPPTLLQRLAGSDRWVADARKTNAQRLCKVPEDRPCSEKPALQIGEQEAIPPAG